MYLVLRTPKNTYTLLPSFILLFSLLWQILSNPSFGAGWQVWSSKKEFFLKFIFTHQPSYDFLCSVPVIKTKLEEQHLMIYHKIPIPSTAPCIVLYFAIKCFILTSSFSILNYLQGHPTISFWKPEQKLWATTTLMVPEGQPQQASNIQGLSLIFPQSLKARSSHSGQSLTHSLLLYPFSHLFIHSLFPSLRISTVSLKAS